LSLPGPMHSPKGHKNFLFILYLAISLAIVGFFVWEAKRIIEGSRAQDARSSDAIAVKVMPNPNHYSARLWYEQRDFTGSPQSVVVDGYAGIRQGRTVYVNAANIDNNGTPADPSDDQLFTNIYLISYNQQAQGETKDVFSQILEHWTFNTNRLAPGSCRQASSTACVLDSDCPRGDYCLSEKARIIRDTKRLAGLTETEMRLEKYKTENGHYPILDSGTYIKHTSISTWPSWQKLLAQYLGGKLPEDPVNELGDCGDPRFNPKTCWDEEAKEFADADPSDPDPDLPAGSRAYVYSAGPKGQSYNTCASMESGYVSSASSSACSTGGVPSASVAAASGNEAPTFTGVNLGSAKSAQPYTGYLEAKDADGDPVSWSMNTSASAWSGWSAPPTLEDTAIAQQKKITASQAGMIGSYSFSITLDDGQGQPNSVVTQNFTINVQNAPPVVQAPDATYTVSATNPLDYNAIAYDDPAHYPLTYSVAGAFPPDLTHSFAQSGSQYDFDIQGTLDSSAVNIPGPTPYSYTLTVGDSYGATTSVNFTITMVNSVPSINLPLGCETVTRVTVPYDTCHINATDPEGHAISSYNAVNLPSGMAINSSGGIYGSPANAGYHQIDVTATDEFGAVSAPESYDLLAETWCGDGTKQTQNDEGRGGPYNDGQEECDGTDGLAANPAASGPDRQYECTTPPICPESGSCAGTCEYTGGWCGDGIVQFGHGEECDENSTNKTQQCQILKDNGITDLDGSTLDCSNLSNNFVSPSGLSDMYVNICDACEIGCTTDPDFDKIGRGCYLDTNNNGQPPDADECQKGRYVCQGGNVVCYDTFTDPNYTSDYNRNGGNPVFDECCRYLDGQVSNPPPFSGVVKVFPGSDYSCNQDNCDGYSDPGNNDPNYLQGPSTSLGFQDLSPDPGGGWNGTLQYTYNCDEVCQMRGMSVCIGVGLTSNVCVRDTCDSGPTCNLAANLVETSCKTDFRYWTSHSCWDGTHVFPVKSTACYCLP